MKRSSYPLSLGLLALGAGVMLFAASRDWVAVTVQRPAPLPTLTKLASGGALQPVIPAVGLLLLTSILLVVVTKRWGRILVGILAAAASVVAFAVTVPLLGSIPADVLDEVGRTGRTVTDSGLVGARWAPWAVVFAAVAALGGGLLVSVFGTSWRGMSSRYERPTASSAEDVAAAKERSDRADWNALDQGIDPT